MKLLMKTWCLDQTHTTLSKVWDKDEHLAYYKRWHSIQSTRTVPRLCCVHTQKKVVTLQRIQAQNRSENTSLTVLDWNGSENAVHTDIEPFRDRFRTVPRTVFGFV